MALTNSYHALMVEAVEATGGYVNQFVGDAVMAIWGAPLADPDHAANAARAALRVVASVMQAKTEADKHGVPGYAIKIGLNTGPAVVGNVGAPQRYNYTAVGETVNIAARLESVPEDYGCRIVIGPNTAAAIADRFVICELDWIKVKGKDTSVFRLPADREKSTANEAELSCLAQYEAGLERYRAGDFAAAEELWRCQAVHPNPGATATCAADGHGRPVRRSKGRTPKVLGRHLRQDHEIGKADLSRTAQKSDQHCQRTLLLSKRWRRSALAFTAASSALLPAAAAGYTAAGDRVFPATVLLPQAAPTELRLCDAVDPAGVGRERHQFDRYYRQDPHRKSRGRDRGRLQLGRKD